MPHAIISASNCRICETTDRGRTPVHPGGGGPASGAGLVLATIPTYCILPKCLYPRNEVADLATDDRVRTFVLPSSLFGNQHNDRPGDGIFTEFYLDQLPLLALLQYPFVAHPGSPCERSLSSFSVNSDRQFRGIKIVNISSFSLENTVLNKYFPCGSCTRKSSLQGHVVFTAPAMTTPRPDTTAIQRRSSSVAEFTVHSAKARQTT